MPPLTQLRPKLLPLLISILSIASFCILVRVQSFSSHSGTTKSASVSIAMTKRSSSSPSSPRWKPLGPENFSSVESPEDGTRYAKDDEYLKAVLESWNQDLTALPQQPQPQRVETSSWTYNDEDGTPLYGHLVRSESSSGDNNSLRPGILLFHTAAGPQDVFLFQKAARLASSDLGCVVLICDIVSDRDGWAWSPDRTRFNEVRGELFRDRARVLRSRVRAAVRALAGGGDDRGFGVDPHRLASLGWCFGAHPILELATLRDWEDGEGGETNRDTAAFSALALVSYHGVYRRDSPPSVGPSVTPSNKLGLDRDLAGEVLICTGSSDPFVAREDLEWAKATMEEHSYGVRIMEFEGAKHGFTNPAQDFNTNPAFQYNAAAAEKSWEATMELLKRKM